MDVDEQGIWADRRKPEAPTTAVELSMDDSLTEDDDYQDTMSDITERGLRDEENTERGELHKQGQQSPWSAENQSMGSLVFNGDWSENESNTKSHAEEMQVVRTITPKVHDCLVRAM